MFRWHFIPFALIFLPVLAILLVYTSPAIAQTPLVGGPTFEQRVLQLVNQERWQNGQLPPLKGDSALDSAAETHSNNMAVRNFFDHCDFDIGSSPWDRMNDAGYKDWSFAGENIAAGYGTPENVVAGWMSSPGHRGNILSADFRETGIGYARQENDEANVREDDDGDCEADSAKSGPYFNYWTQNFGRRDEIMPVVINREAYETSNRTVNLYLYGSGWAQSMRLRNEAENWSSWQPFATDVSWELSCSNGGKTVAVEISNGPNGAGTVRSAQDGIVLNGGSGSLRVTPNTLAYVAYTDGGPTSLEKGLTLYNEGGQATTWEVAENPAVNWLDISLVNGKLEPCLAADLVATVSITGLSPGAHTTTLLIHDNANKVSQQVPVILLYTDQPSGYLPYISK